MSDIFIIRAIGKARPATPYDGELLHPLRFRYTGRDHFPRSSIRLGDWVFLMCDRATTLWRGPPYETFPAEKFQVIEVEREICPGVSRLTIEGRDGARTDFLIKSSRVHKPLSERFLDRLARLLHWAQDPPVAEDQVGKIRASQDVNDPDLPPGLLNQSGH